MRVVHIGFVVLDVCGVRYEVETTFVERSYIQYDIIDRICQEILLTVIADKLIV